MPYFQTLPDFETNEKLLKLLMLFLKILYYRGYLGKIWIKIWRNLKFHDWHPTLHSSRHRLLIRFGFLVNLAKSQWDPSHVIVWLGSVIDTIQGTIADTEQRMRKFLNFIHLLSDCESRVVKAKDLASFIGMIISLFPFAGNVAHIRTRSCTVPGVKL